MPVAAGHRKSAQPEWPAMPAKLKKHLEFAANRLQRLPLEISGTMSKHQLKLADRQCRMAGISQQVQNLLTIVATGLYAARQDDDIVRDAADVVCQELTALITSRALGDRYFRAVTKLGASVAEGAFKSIAGLEPEEILMPYENQ